VQPGRRHDCGAGAGRILRRGAACGLRRALREGSTER
jgi:hypothetical protein